METQIMLQSVLGITLLALPFLGIFCFENRYRGFFTIFTLSAAFHLSVALFSQSFHVFTYGTLLVLHILFVSVFVYFFVNNRKPIGKLKTSIFAVASFCIIFFFLFSIHFRYSGIVDDGFGARVVTNSSYTYPLYSDEWIAVALADYAIESKSLPLVNPLNANAPFGNLLVVFHSLVAEIMLLLGLTPLYHYVWLAIVNGALICFCIFTLLRLSNVGIYASAVSAMGAVFITNSGNLPGIWYLLPYNLSLTFLFMSTIGFLLRSNLIIFLSIFLSLVLYPPMVVFAMPMIIAFLISDDSFRQIVLKYKLLISIIFIVPLIFYFNDVLPFLIRANLEGGIVSYGIWNVLPFFILPFSFIGFWIVLKKKLNYFIYPTAIGLAFWVVYSFANLVFVIEPARIVVITSIFLVIVSGYGLHGVSEYFEGRYVRILDPFTKKCISILVLIFFVVLTLFSSRFGLWHKFVLTVKESGGKQTYIPSPPITRYLSEDDLELFSDIKGKRFISPLWKGLVIGVATGNYPLDSKASTISYNVLSYDEFLKADCRQKEVLAEKFKMDFAYTTRFSCARFIEVGKSREGLVLYHFSTN